MISPVLARYIGFTKSASVGIIAMNSLGTAIKSDSQLTRRPLDEELSSVHIRDPT